VSAGELTPEAQAAARRALRQRLRDDDPEVRAIVEAVAPWLNRNPREIKRFVNVFRFYVLIRQGRQEAGLPVPDSLEQVAKLAVLAVRWPQLRGILGRQIGPEDGDTLLALLETPWMNCPLMPPGRSVRRPWPRSSPTPRFRRSCNKTCLPTRLFASVSLTAHRSVPQRADFCNYRQQVRP
jgi:hypothetical protein